MSNWSYICRIVAFYVTIIVPSASMTEPVQSQDRAAKRANRLATESSPYLQLHAQNPVDWYPWGPEALERAASENKPIFLSIGYSSCYWCHVMERQVFENEEIAAYMNEHFINIKVDREERPDIDEIYMLCLQVYFQLAGSSQGGGWPLSIFLTPDGKPIAGGTYFPAQDMPGRPGFMNILKNVESAWRERKDDILATAELVTTEVKRLSSPQLTLTPVEINSALVAKSIDSISTSFDPEYGGFDFDPTNPDTAKFPIPARLELLQTIGPFAETAPDLMRKLDFTLTKMEQGGIRDHLGGGFHRYSTDRIWLVPHFEKMLYDNAQLASVYTRAYARTSLKTYRHVAEGTLDFLLRDMCGTDGGFHSALDAETNGVEGLYYVWRNEEVAQLLSPEEYLIVQKVYGIGEKSPFEIGSVLHLTCSLPDSAEKLQMPIIELEAQLATIQKKLLSTREQRPALLKDDKVLVGWNGMAIQAFAEAGQIFQRREYLDSAERAANLLLRTARSESGQLLHVMRDGVAKGPAFLEDYSALVAGLLALHQATEDRHWFDEAVRLTDEMMEQCSDPKGGFFLTSTRHEELLVRPKNAYDSVTPSGNSQAVRNLVRLAKITGDMKYQTAAWKTIQVFAPQVETSPAGHAFLAIGIAEYLSAFPTDGLSTPMASVNQSPGTTPVTKHPENATEGLIVCAKPTSEECQRHPLLQVEALIPTGAYRPGEACPLTLRIQIKEGWHINANPARPKFLKPTEWKAEFSAGSTIGPIEYPEGSSLTLEGFEEPLSVYEGTIEMNSVITVPSEAPGQETITLTLKYQACNDKECQGPKRIVLQGVLPPME